MNRLHLIIGPMFAGKTTTLINAVTKLQKEKKNVLVVKHISHTRDGSKIKKHNGIEEVEEKGEQQTCYIDCLMISALEEIDNRVKEFDYIIIDEAQFMPNLCLWIVDKLDKTHISFIIAGLDSDYKRESFVEILQLIPHSDKITRLSSLCSFCMKTKTYTKAIYTHRTHNNIFTQQLLVEGKDVSYFPVCRSHYNELNKFCN